MSNFVTPVAVDPKGVLIARNPAGRGAGMTQSREFSIFLLKENYDAATAVRDDTKMIESVPATNLPPGATLLVRDGELRMPWWKSYFGVQRDLLQSSKGALIFLPVSNRVFALAFGHVAHNLRDESYEYDFGIRVTLNCVDPKKLKNTDTLEPGSARRRRTQHAVETELTYFDFDHDSAVLKSITGKVKTEYRDLLRQATGASNLRVSTKVASKDLPQLCDRLLQLYADDSYVENFPDIQKIVPVRDPGQLVRLNERLAEAVRTQDDAVLMAVPLLVDYNYHSDGVYAAFSGSGPSLLYPDVNIEHFYHYLSSNGASIASMTIEDLRKQRLRLVNEYGDTRDSFTVYKSLLFDTRLKGSESAFYLNEGNWYEVDKDYVRRLQTTLDPYWSDLSFLDECDQHLEADYNSKTGERPDFVCLDTTDVRPPGQTQIEPCDIYTVIDGRATLIHVKISTSSSELSHLFNQGTNATELLKTDDEAPGRLVALLQEKRKGSDDMLRLLRPIESNDLMVVFAIITTKDPTRKSLNLPLFSRISLARNVKALHRVMGVPVQFGFIKDNAVRRKAKPKTRRPRTKSKGKPRR